MCRKHSLAIWLFCLTFFGLQHQDNQVKHTEASKQYITANKAFSTKIPTTITTTPTTTETTRRTSSSSIASTAASIGTTKQVIGDVLQIEDEEYVELAEDTIIQSESIPDLNDNEDDNDNDDHQDTNALTVYHLRNQMNDVQKKNAIKRKYLLQELLRQHEQTFKETQQIYNDTGGGSNTNDDDDDHDDGGDDASAGNEGKSILLPINNKSLLKYSKHKKNVGDTLAFDFKQNVLRLFNNTKSNDNHSHKELHVNNTLASLLPVTIIGEITIKQGRLIGIRRTFHSSTGLRDVDQYLGLPYAESPIGSRRFMPPERSSIRPVTYFTAIELFLLICFNACLQRGSHRG
uniref:COesterase domain-containing protein n=1 Tax=Glossina austeni TaxID=7395 RepID=A0A1A9VW81_GLOAU